MHLSRNDINNLEHAICPGLCEVANHTRAPIPHLKTPTTEEELRLLIEFGHALCWFVPKFARVASPLTTRLSKAQAAVVGQLREEELATVRTLQEKLISPPVRALLRKK